MAELLQFPLRDEIDPKRSIEESDRLTDEGAAIVNTKPHKAVCLFADAIRLNPKNATAVFNLGICCINLKRLRKAEECFRQAILLKPENPLAHYNLGYVLEERELFEGAETAFLRALALEPSYADTHFNLAFLYSRRLGKPLKALRHFYKYARLSRNRDNEGYMLVREETRRILANQAPKLRLVS